MARGIATKPGSSFGNAPDDCGVGALGAFVASALLIVLTACSGGGGGGSSQPPPPPAVMVSVSPGSAMLYLGATQQFAASVTGTSNTDVSWAVNGVAGGNASVGTITSGGLFSAPGILPSPAKVTVTATSAADGEAMDSAAVTIQSDVAVSVLPTAATVAVNATQNFTASVTGSGKPDISVTWSVSDTSGGKSGGTTTEGTILSTAPDAATYTAPALPPAGTVQVTATSVADPSKSASATVTVDCAGQDSVAPAAVTLGLGATQNFTAMLCVPAGTTIVWDVDGTVGGNSTLGTIMVTGASTAMYLTPAALPATNPVTIHATGQGTGHTAAAVVTLTSNAEVFVTPRAASAPVTLRVTLTPTVINATDTSVTWEVNGTANGSATVGLVCVHTSNPCAAPAGPAAGAIDYMAPAEIPATNPVTLTATSNANPASQASATMTILAAVPVGVSISPALAAVAPGMMQQFTSAVTGSSNTAVAWSLSAAVGGASCTAATCGTIAATGLYAAPGIPPSPNSITVMATSVADATKSATATAAIATGPVIEQILPSSVVSGVTGDFPVVLNGLNFSMGSGSGASAVLLNGVAQATTCPTANQCLITLSPGDVASGTTLTLQVQDAGTPGPLSNAVPFVVAAYSNTPEVITLSGTEPSATGEDVIAAEYSTEGTGEAPLNINFAGPLSNTDGNIDCTLQDTSVTVFRPASGSAVSSICAQGDNLQNYFVYELSGPADTSIAAISLDNLFPNLMELDITLSATTQPGCRSLWITDTDNNTAVITGALEVK